MTQTPLKIAYTDRYLDWQLGEGHPTNPIRAKIAVDLLRAYGVKFTWFTPLLHDWIDDYLLEVHDPTYVAEVTAGFSNDWNGERPDLGQVAKIMFQGTVSLVHWLEDTEGDGYRVAFNPQGAKHHAAYDHSSGFCVFNDMAWAAQHFAARGKKVAYLDWDVHHGDGVEDLTADNLRVLTASIHQRGIFPGTGNEPRPELNIFNWALPWHFAAEQWEHVVRDALDEIRDFEPDVLLLAAGADAHITDPLASGSVYVDTYAEAAQHVREYAKERELPVLVGGAGGYQPTTWTPTIWATVIRELVQ